MKELEQLEQIAHTDWWRVFLAICLVLFCVKILWSLVDWIFVEKLGIKTRKMRQREQNDELLKATAQLAQATAENLDKLRERYTKDEEEFRQNLNNYIEESREDSRMLHDEVTKFNQNRANDRQVSIEREKRLNDRTQ